MPAKLTIKDFVKRAIDIHGSKYDYNLVQQAGSYAKNDIFCHKHQCLFTQSWDSHIIGQHGCPICGREHQRQKMLLSTQDFINKANKIHNYLYQYNDTEYNGSKKKIVIICRLHGKFKQFAHNHLQGAGCPKCGLTKRYRSNTKEFILKAKKIHGNKYNYDKTNYTHCDSEVIIVCDRGHSFLQTPHNHLRGYGCKICYESQGEKRIRVYLENNNINFQQEYLIPNTRKRFDFYLLDYNTCIEFNGKQHYTPQYFGGSNHIDNKLDKLKKTWMSDKFKQEWCDANNIIYFQIHYWEFSQINNILDWFFNYYVR